MSVTETTQETIKAIGHLLKNEGATLSILPKPDGHFLLTASHGDTEIRLEIAKKEELFNGLINQLIFTGPQFGFFDRYLSDHLNAPFAGHEVSILITTKDPKEVAYFG